MEIFKELTNPASKEFEKLLNSQLSKVNIEEGKIINAAIDERVKDSWFPGFGFRAREE